MCRAGGQPARHWQYGRKSVFHKQHQGGTDAFTTDRTACTSRRRRGRRPRAGGRARIGAAGRADQDRLCDGLDRPAGGERQAGAARRKNLGRDRQQEGGLLGRPVKLVYYDDQSNPSTVPGIYTKLLDVDKVELVVGPYATAQIAPAMPVIIQKGKMFIGLFGLAVNSEFNYPKYFAMIPSGPNTKPAFTE